MKCFYSELSFMRDVELEKQELQVDESLVGKELIETDSGSRLHYQFMDWESSFFGAKIAKILLWEGDKKKTDDLLELHKALKSSGVKFIYTEVPTEDLSQIHLLGASQYHLQETRMHFFQNEVQSFDPKQRFLVREGDINDEHTLMEVARSMRNNYDRTHADPFYSQIQADEYVATYVSEALKGFADFVVVPDEKSVPSRSFVTVDYRPDLEKYSTKRIAKIGLMASDKETNRGWNYKLISEILLRLKSEKFEVLLINTQSTNRAVHRNLYKLGFQLGRVTHVYSAQLDQ